MRRPFFLALTAVLVATVPSQAQQKVFLNKNAGLWVNQLADKDAGQRRNAAFGLGKLGPHAAPALPSMRAAFNQEKDAKVKEAILFAMGEICRDIDADARDASYEPLFISALRDNDLYVRRSAVYALGCLANKSPATQKALAAAIEDQEPIVRQNAAWAIGRCGNDVLHLIKTGLRDGDTLVKRDAASALLQIEDADKVHEMLKDLLPLCRDSSSEVRRAALNVLVRIVEPKDKEAIPALKAAIEDRDIENRRNAALALSNIGGEQTAVALPVLIEAIKNGDEELRRQAALAIRNIGPSASKAVPELTRLLREDKDVKMREHAAFAIGGIGAPAESAINVLVAKIKDTNENLEVRVVCATSLGRIGAVPGASAVAPDLLGVLGSSQQHSRVRERVMWALRPHGENLTKMKGAKEAFTRVLGEQFPYEGRMLRYDCAYMLGMIWGPDAPEATLDVLTDFLNDKEIKIFVGTSTSTGPTGTEIKGGKTDIKDQGKGDGRIMAADALQRMGAGRYAKRPAIINQLRALANDNSTYAPLRTKAAALVKAAQ